MPGFSVATAAAPGQPGRIPPSGFGHPGDTPALRFAQSPLLGIASPPIKSAIPTSPSLPTIAISAGVPSCIMCTTRRSHCRRPSVRRCAPRIPKSQCNRPDDSASPSLEPDRAGGAGIFHPSRSFFPWNCNSGNEFDRAAAPRSRIRTFKRSQKCNRPAMSGSRAIRSRSAWIAPCEEGR
jgi:hypothetical protein